MGSCFGSDVLGEESLEFTSLTITGFLRIPIKCNTEFLYMAVGKYRSKISIKSQAVRAALCQRSQAPKPLSTHWGRHLPLSLMTRSWL